MSRILYNAALYMSLPALAPLAAWKLISKPAYREDFFQKLGYFLPRQTKKTIWIHAVSVGEAMASARLAKELSAAQNKYRIMFSTSTPTGKQVARKNLPPEITVFYFPFDFCGAASRAVEAINPAALVLVDTELWPNVIHACARRKAPVILVNGRVSDKSFERYMKVKRLIHPTMEEISYFFAQSQRDMERLVAMGAPSDKAVPGGALKFDQSSVDLTPEERAAIRKSLGIGGGEVVIILGSVHKGEEEAVKAAALAAGRHGARIVIAPRRIENLEWIEEALKSHGYGIARRSANDVMSLGDNKLVPVIDTFGELGRIYAVSDIAFTGGSFIPHGGQNPLEPAGCGLPVLFGPDMSNFDEASKALENAGGAWRVQSGEELSSRLERLIDDKALRLKAGASARGMVEKGRGAVDRAREKILELAGACD